MIIPLKKFLFIGVLEDLNHFFDAAQKKGIIEFIPDQSHPTKPSREIAELVEALQILKHYHVEESIFPEGMIAQEIVAEILEVQQKLKEKTEEKLALEKEIASIAPLGAFLKEDIQWLEKQSGRKFFFYFAKRSSVFTDDHLVLINTDHEADFYFSLTHDPVDDPRLTLIPFHSSLDELKLNLQLAKVEIKKMDQLLKNLAPYADFLREEMIQKINAQELVHAKESVGVALEGQLFQVMCWIPENAQHQLIGLTQQLAVHFEEVRIEPTDRVPTYMENRGIGKMGEDLVHIYDVPAAQDKDPSQWVFFSFAIFFAMIISDAAYGLIYFLLALFLQRKIKKPTPSVNRVIKTIQWVAGFTMVWGVIAGSYFSIPLNQESFLMRFSLINQVVKTKVAYHIEAQDEVYQELISQYPETKGIKDPARFIMAAVDKNAPQMRYPIQEEFQDQILLELSLLLGILHLSISFLRHVKVSYPGIGWVLAMIGGYLYFPGFLGATSLVHYFGWITKEGATLSGFQLLFGGFGLAVVLSLYQNKWAGLNEITNSIQVFADVLSYLRLYALGLAGMLLASTANMMGRDLGFVLGALIAVSGHVINISLGIMAGMIHGLRLNFLEWYRYSFTGGGKLFRPLRLIQGKKEF